MYLNAEHRHVTVPQNFTPAMFRGRNKGIRGRGRSGVATKVPLKGLFADGIWQCNCDPRLPAQHFQTKNGGKNHGRWCRFTRLGNVKDLSAKTSQSTRVRKPSPSAVTSSFGPTKPKGEKQQPCSTIHAPSHCLLRHHILRRNPRLMD